MQVNMDLHYHSGASGGVGKIKLADFHAVAPKKGIQVVGTGDCLHDQTTDKIPVTWRSKLEAQLVEVGPDAGLFRLQGETGPGKTPRNAFVHFILQTEVIFTCALATGERKSVHTLFFFPSFAAVEEVLRLLAAWEVKTTIGRPYITCETNQEVSERILAILAVDDLIEMVPAHVMTPTGVYGSKNPINFLEEFYGAAAAHIHCVETGLSADPEILGMIPELDDVGLVSNSDAHSIHLHRLGREFTTVDVPELTYPAIIGQLRARKITRTAEFNPTEGKYFLTGHRAGKKGHGKDKYCVFSPAHTPESGLCPICRQPLTVGVLERAYQLTRAQGADRDLRGENSLARQEFVHMVPLVEILAKGYCGVKSPTAKRVTRLYDQIVEVLGNEAEVWFGDDPHIRDRLEEALPEGEALADLIETVKAGNFRYAPIGFDGTYGNLEIGTPQDPADLFETELIHGRYQKTL